jgi:putative addiction module component (TIGR02574 family)
MGIDLSELLALPAAERARLAQALWESIHRYPGLDALPMSEAEKAELGRRLDQYEAEGEPANGRPADEVLAELRRSL